MNFSVSWQLGLVEREINGILRGITTQQEQRRVNNAAARTSSSKTEDTDATPGGGGVKQREITEDDVCPICQEEFLTKRAPVTYCRFEASSKLRPSLTCIILFVCKRLEHLCSFLGTVVETTYTSSV